MIHALWFAGDTVMELSGVKNIYKGVEYFKDTINWFKENEDRSYKDISHVNKILTKHDIEVKIEIIKTVCKEIEKRDIQYVSSIKYCIEQIEKSITDVEFVLECIKTKINKFETLWFSTWRISSFKKELENLDIKCSVFENRVKTLVRIVNLHLATLQIFIEFPGKKYPIKSEEKE